MVAEPSLASTGAAHEDTVDMVSARRVAAPPMVAVDRAGAQARELAAIWSVLDGGLAAGGPLWRQEPFRRVMDRSDGMDDLERALAEGADIRVTVPGLACLLQAVEALEPPPTPLSEQRLLPARLAAGVPGRKWAQAQAFADALSDAHDVGGPIVDWCSGKGHLARVLCHRGCCSSAHCLELDEGMNQRARTPA